MARPSLAPATEFVSQAPNRVLRPADAAAFLGMAPKTLAQLRLRGEGPAYVSRYGRCWGYRYSDLEQWLAAAVVAPAARC